jgi:hypothetical protein
MNSPVITHETGVREERKLNLKLVVTARFQWRFESSPRHQLDTRTTRTYPYDSCDPRNSCGSCGSYQGVFAPR